MPSPAALRWKLGCFELARQGVDDAAVAGTLTQGGPRSPRCGYVPARSAQLVRQRHGVLRDGVVTRACHISGWLAIAAVAPRLQGSPSWVKRRIHNGTSPSSVIRATSATRSSTLLQASQHLTSSSQANEITSLSTRGPLTPCRCIAATSYLKC
jgi:hypothetical protein